MTAKLFLTDSKAGSKERAPWWRDGLDAVPPGFESLNTLSLFNGEVPGLGSPQTCASTVLLLLHFSDVRDDEIGEVVRRAIKNLGTACARGNARLRILLFSGDAAVLCGWKAKLATEGVDLQQLAGTKELFEFRRSVDEAAGDDGKATSELHDVLWWLGQERLDQTRMPRWLRAMTSSEHTAALIHHMLGPVLAGTQRTGEAITNVAHIIDLLQLGLDILDPVTNKELVEAMLDGQWDLFAAMRTGETEVQRAIRRLSRQVRKVPRSVYTTASQTPG